MPSPRRRAALATVPLALLLALAGLGCSPATPRSDPGSIGPSSGSASRSSGAQEPAAPSPPPAPAPEQDPTALREGGRSATVMMSGDLLWHSDLWHAAAEVAAITGRAPYDFSRLFQDIRPLVEDADMAICHEEVPFAPDGTEPSGYPVFGAPQEVAPFIAESGWDLCTTSSNHSVDKGMAGVETTLRELDRVGILHTGTFRSVQERATPAIFTTQGDVRIAVVSATYGTNGIPLPEGAPWSVALLDTEDMLARAQAARRAGADIVLAAVHAGDEYQMMPNQEQVDTATALTASPDIDLVYGHHVHVVQPWDRINGKWVVYGLGNLVANHEVERRRAYEGVSSRFTFSERNDGTFEVTRAEYVPTMVTEWWPGLDLRLWPVVGTLDRGEGETELLRIAREKSHEAVFALGVPEGPEGVEER